MYIPSVIQAIDEPAQSGTAPVFILPQPFLIINYVLTAAGLLILITLLIRQVRKGRGDLFAASPERPNNLRPELIIIPMIFFLSFYSIVSFSLSHYSSEAVLLEAIGLISNIVAQLLGGVVCLLLAHATFQKGILGFVLGDFKIPAQLGWGVLSFVTAFPLCWGAMALAIWVMTLLNPQTEFPQHQILEILQKPHLPTWLYPLLWFSAVVVAPFAEEVFFRGICQTSLKHIFKKPLWSVLIVSVVFGLAHSDQPQVVASLIILGLFLGYAYERTGSLVAPIVLHFLFNLRTMIDFSIMQTQT